MRDTFGSMNKTTFGALRVLAVLSVSLAFGVARAQDTESPDADPPDRAARLSYLQGDVSLQPAGEEDWAGAIVNRPLTTGDKLWTDQGARAEIDVGRAAVRLDGGTGFSFLNVDDETIQMRVTAGVINVTVRELGGNEHMEIDTPNLALSLLRPGNYRVEVDDEGDTSIVRVSEGLAEANGGSQDVIVHAQQVVTFRGTEQQLAAQFGTLGAPDEFDSWSLERERRDERAETSQTARYVSPDVTGYEDLDDNGTWHSEAEYGYVWTPSHVAVGWSPYSYGRWAWVAPWGWTWIDDAPWGFAPFHYGRWAHVRNRWCWVPGPRHVRAVYAPALVGWAGPRGGVAWFPLGPREVYVPAHRYSHRYVERVNVSNTIIVNRSHLTNVYGNQITTTPYRNRSVPGAMIAVAHNTFTSAERVNGHRMRVDDREITRAPVTATAPRIEPARESRLGGVDARRNVRIPPREIVSRQVVVRRDPPPASAHFARPVARTDVRREPTVPASRPLFPQNQVPQNQVPQNWRDNRSPESRQQADRPQQEYRTRVDGQRQTVVPQPAPSQQPVQRPWSDRDRHPEIRQQVREHLERRQQAPAPQPAPQVQPQPQYQPREQRSQPQPQYQPREQRSQPPREQQPQRPAEQRQQTESRRPAEDKPQSDRSRNNSRADSYDTRRR
jgi:hypothetical protein